MGLFEDSQDTHDQVYNNDVTDDNKSSFTHELVGGAAAFEAMRLYEQKQASDGTPENHQLAKEMIAGLAGAEADKLCETKGLDFVDREKAKWHAREQAKQMLDERQPE